MRTYWLMKAGKVIIDGTPKKCRAWKRKLELRNIKEMYVSNSPCNKCGADNLKHYS